MLERLGGPAVPFRSGDAVRAGISRTVLSRMHQRGRVVRLARGVYQLAGTRPVDPIAVLAVTHPSIVVCLLSALSMYQLTTQVPHQVWVAIPNKAAAPRADSPPLQIVRMTDASLNAGVVEKSVDGVVVRVTTPARTVADCFKFRNRVGLDVAVEALHTAWESGAVTMDQLWQAAASVRMTNVMRPYVEMLS